MRIIHKERTVLKRKPGYRNLFELTEEEKDNIIDFYYTHPDIRTSEIGKHFKLVSRAMHDLFQERGIASQRKNRYTLNESYFETIDCERKAYWLGYLYADGYVGDEHFNNIVFSQKYSDHAIIDEFIKDIDFSGNARVVINSGGFIGEPGYVVNFSSIKMANDLRRLKMYPGKSTTMSKLPPINESLMRHFIRGYFDGDGSISHTVKYVRKDGTVYYSDKMSIIGTLPFLQKISEFIPGDKRFVDSHTDSMKYLYYWHKSDMILLFHFLYDDATVFLKRKHDKWLDVIRGLGDKTSEANGINP